LLAAYPLGGVWIVNHLDNFVSLRMPTWLQQRPKQLDGESGSTEKAKARRLRASQAPRLRIKK